MERRKSLMRWAGILGAMLTVSVCAMAMASGGAEKQADDGKRADVIVIDSMKKFGALEQPAVLYLHDKHTDALKDADKDCLTCHKKTDEGSISLKFMRMEDKNASSLKDTYHENCIGCHKSLAAAGKKAGPDDVDCKGCHAGAAGKNVSAAVPYGMDKSLHARHVAAEAKLAGVKPDESCKSCHHKYDEAAKKLVYAKGEEGTCRYCHETESTEKVRSMREASHGDCVTCHRELTLKKVEGVKVGPVKCAGCHSAEAQAKVEVLKEVPRLKRGQPDATLITSGEKVVDGVRVTLGEGVAPVAFDHKAHEGYTDTCRACHHASMESCSARCHTSKGTKEGGFVQLSDAMHLATSNASCVGCHAKRTAEPQCAGCHAQMPAATKSEKSCAVCHVQLPASTTGETVLSDKQKSEMATAMLAERSSALNTYSENDIPEKVVIEDLADQFQPSEMPHRKIVLKLMEGVKDSKLAGAFHGTDKATLCQGCHHNSPASSKPPKCGTCHGKPFDPKTPDRPGLKGALHLQCIGCHDAMKLEKPKATACAECHKEKK